MRAVALFEDEADLADLLGGEVVAQRELRRVAGVWIVLGRAGRRLDEARAQDADRESGDEASRSRREDPARDCRRRLQRPSAASALALIRASSSSIVCRSSAGDASSSPVVALPSVHAAPASTARTTAAAA